MKCQCYNHFPICVLAYFPHNSFLVWVAMAVWFAMRIVCAECYIVTHRNGAIVHTTQVYHVSIGFVLNTLHHHSFPDSFKQKIVAHVCNVNINTARCQYLLHDLTIIGLRILFTHTTTVKIGIVLCLYLHGTHGRLSFVANCRKMSSGVPCLAADQKR